VPKTAAKTKVPASPSMVELNRRKLERIRKFAEDRGLLSGKTHVVRGRIPDSLVAAAKKNTGIESDTELVKTGLASLAAEDSYAEWLLSRSRAIPPEIDLEF